MNAETPDLEQLMARLLSDDSVTRLQAKEEVQSWPFETAATMLNLCVAQANAAIETPSRLQRFLARWIAPRCPPPFPLYFDMLAVLLAERMEDTRLARAALLALTRYYAYKCQLERAEANEERPGWGSGMALTPQFRIQINPSSFPAEEASAPAVFYSLSSRYEVYEKPLLSALKRLLPQIEPGQITITHNERLALLQPLRYPYRDVELTLGALGALAWAGGAECVRTVEVIEAKSLETENGRRICAAARSCREQIQSRLDTNRQAQTLLRAADPDTLCNPETLLRPLPENAPETAPELLLRPVE